MTEPSIRRQNREDAPEPEEWLRQTPTTRRLPSPPPQPARSYATCPMTFYMREAISLSALTFPHINKSALRIQFPRENVYMFPTAIFALVISVDSVQDDVRFRGNNVTLLPPGLPPRTQGFKESMMSKVNRLIDDRHSESSDGGGRHGSSGINPSDDPHRKLGGTSSSHLQEITPSDMNKPLHRQTDGTQNENLKRDPNDNAGRSLTDYSSDTRLTATNPFQQKIVALKSLWDCLNAHLEARRGLEPDTDDSTWDDYASDMTDEGDDDGEMVVDADDIAQTAREAVQYAEELERVHELPRSLEDGEAG